MVNSMNQMNKDSNSINITGLTDEEVRQRVEEGFTNRTDISTDKTTKEIVISNVFTYFNLIFLVITILLIMVGSFRNLTFLPIIIGNTVIGIVQEIRAKKTLEKMSLLNAPHADVIRNGSVKQISTEGLVKDDVILLTAGKQICADAVVISGNIQVNESLLTGEADEVEKTEGSTLMSGSFVVSGECYARLEKVGNESYISRLSLEAKSMGDKEQSEMIRSINLIVKWVGIVIIPIGLILFWQSHFVNGESITKSVTSTVAAIIGMIPEGLYLLTTVALALSTMKLARKKVLLHDMKSIETLARVDVLCVDKTGTITEPDMKLKEIFLCKNSGADGTQTALTLDELKSLILDYANASVDNNATMLALKAYAAEALTNNTSALHRTAVSQQAFSSSLKYGSVTFSDGTYLLGAPEFIMHEDFARIEEEIIPYADKGDRVLLFARYNGENVENGINGSVTPLGFVALANPIRANAVKTFEYFKSQGVAIKVISGDNPRTVSRIAIQAGIESAESFVDAATLDIEDKIADAVNKYTVFGRVTPKQKKQLVKALQAKGHTVAMTGDGVNDILAMKDADCSVAMASGSEAAAQAAQVVLLDSDFAHMPDVYVPCEVCHGKRYNRETLEVRYKGKSIADVLDMTINQAVEFFEAVPQILQKIKALQDVGLGYIKLGQSSTTLSGGESQRVKLATELSKRDTGKTLYILDEPTTGLHFEDIRILMNVLQKLVDRGNTVIIIEHNLDVIKLADYIIDMGPEGGRGGGTLLCAGTPEKVAKSKKGYTPRFLSEELK